MLLCQLFNQKQGCWTPPWLQCQLLRLQHWWPQLNHRLWLPSVSWLFYNVLCELTHFNVCFMFLMPPLDGKVAVPESLHCFLSKISERCDLWEIKLNASKTEIPGYPYYLLVELCWRSLMTLIHWEWHLILRLLMRSIFAQLLKGLIFWSPGKNLMIDTPREMVSGFCSAHFGVLFCTLHCGALLLKLLYCVVSDAGF